MTALVLADAVADTVVLLCGAGAGDTVVDIGCLLIVVLPVLVLVKLLLVWVQLLEIFLGNDLVENVAAERLQQTPTHLCRARTVLARLSDDTFGVKGLHTSTLMHHVYDDVVAVVYLVSEGEAELKQFVDREDNRRQREVRFRSAPLGNGAEMQSFMNSFDDVNDIGCKLFTWISYILRGMSYWMPVLLTVERAVAVLWPHRVADGEDYWFSRYELCSSVVEFHDAAFEPYGEERILTTLRQDEKICHVRPLLMLNYDRYPSSQGGGGVFHEEINVRQHTFFHNQTAVIALTFETELLVLMVQIVFAIDSASRGGTNASFSYPDDYMIFQSDTSDWGLTFDMTDFWIRGTLPLPLYIIGTFGNVISINVNDICCKLFAWISYILRGMSYWMPVLLTMERAVAVLWPHRVAVDDDCWFLRVKRGADVATDHHLLVATMKIKLRSFHDTSDRPHYKFNVQFLRDRRKQNEFNCEVKNRFATLEGLLEKTGKQLDRITRDLEECLHTCSGEKRKKAQGMADFRDLAKDREKERAEAEDQKNVKTSRKKKSSEQNTGRSTRK
ncbi:hypothetical protein C0Q70_12462 [Pomacea canaliculata]|uniref:Uncharacterized protein n=1 Tax=Pomacea canaliculata TaxID=400727 RepID=A0A2T7P1K8_POMCA|nr:hypothetical protein C0Q70_12462 [Pomacea canaliculata]